MGSWVKYLPENGFYPIVVTRNWTGEELSEEERLRSSGDAKRKVEGVHSTVYYLPYKSSLRDYLFRKGTKNILFRFSSKALTVINILLRNLSVKCIPYHNLYTKSKEILLKEPDIEFLIISANPFEQFFFGYRLKKQFPHLKWIADYRDDWSTSEIERHLFPNLQARFERKWVNTASKIISVSPHYTSKISSFTKVGGETIYNGYDFQVQGETYPPIKGFTITYNGTLYPTQPIEIFLAGLKKFIRANPNEKVLLNFPGLKINAIQVERVVHFMKGFESNLWISDRIPKQEIIELQNKSDVLLMVAHEEIKGIPSSKVFEYIGLRKQFIVCPGDNDVLDSIAHTSELGHVLQTSEDVFLFLEQQLKDKKSGLERQKVNLASIQQYSVVHQVKKLSTLLNTL